MTAILRPMQATDLATVLEWRNAEDVRNNMYTNHVISAGEHRAWWERQSSDPATRLLVCEIDGEPAGVVTFTRYTGAGGTATWAFYSGDRSRRGVGKAMEAAALEYAFEELLLHRLECEVLAFNMPVVNFHLKHGFTIEGVAREAYKRDGVFHDIYKLAMLSREWEKHVKPLVESGAETLAGAKYMVEMELTPGLVDAFAAATGDRNPVHLDASAARAMGFPDRIAHGMLVGGAFSRFFASEFPGPGTIYLSQTLEFHAPIPVGAHAQLRFRVASHLGRRLVLETSAWVGETKCVDGVAILMVPKGFKPGREAGH